MKALLIILIIYLSLISCDDIDKLIKNPRLHSKKLKQGQIKILHSGKKFINDHFPSFKVKTKAVTPKRTPYSAFPIINAVPKKSDGIPDSPYFPLAKNYDHLPIAKTLNADSSSRRKRSVSGSNTTHVAKTVSKTAAHSSAKNVSHVKHGSGKGKRVTKAHNKVASKKRRKPQKIKRMGKISKSQINKKKGNATRLSKNKKIQRERIELTYNEKRGKSKQRKNGNNTRHVQIGRFRKPKKLKHPTNHTLKSKSGKGKGKVDARRLIAGKDATIEEFPYVVSIQKNRQHWCAGALLNPQLVITTANCIWKSNRISRLRIRAGSRYTDRGGQEARIQEVMKHPGWGIRRDPDNDVALILLDKRIKFSDKVHGVDLPNRVMMPVFEDAWVASWGADRRDGVYDTKEVNLQSYHARLIDRAKCNNMTQRFGVTVTENFICFAQTGKRGPCTRDTGAPAVSDGVLWGLASWGIRKLCGTERFPSMFSYIASKSNMDFIVNATHYLMADERFYPFPGRFPSDLRNTRDSAAQ